MITKCSLYIYIYISSGLCLNTSHYVKNNATNDVSRFYNRLYTNIYIILSVCTMKNKCHYN